MVLSGRGFLGETEADRETVDGFLVAMRIVVSGSRRQDLFACAELVLQSAISSFLLPSAAEVPAFLSPKVGISPETNDVRHHTASRRLTAHHGVSFNGTYFLPLMAEVRFARLVRPLRPKSLGQWHKCIGIAR